MSLGIALIFGVSLYVATISVVFYLCILADPEKNEVAKYVSETLPQQIMLRIEQKLGQRTVDVIQACLDRAMIVIYCAIVFGAWSVIFFYIYPWVDQQQYRYVPLYHKYIGYVIFVSCVASWRAASTTQPGIITRHNLERYNHFPPDEILFPPPLRQCPSRNIPKLPRSKFDRYKYHDNIARYDHFCGWVYNTIGEENYRWFLLFLLVHWGMCTYGSVMIFQLFLGEIAENGLDHAVFVDRSTGQEFVASRMMIAQYLFGSRTMEACVLALTIVMAATLFFFLGYHVYLTSLGMTTNESYKWTAVDKWYKSELKRYNEAVKNGHAVIHADCRTAQPDNTGTSNNTVNSTASSSPIKQKVQVTDDADVTCTPSTTATVPQDTVVPVKPSNHSNSNSEEDDDDNNDIPRHPGPKPVNIYNRGLIENWKEVIFPISLRQDRNVPGFPFKKAKLS